MSGLPAKVEAITLFIANRQTSREFFRTIFAIEPIFEDQVSVAFGFGSLIVNLLEAPAAHSLIAPAAVGTATSGACFQLTIGVPDTDTACALLAEHGVKLLNGPMNRAWGLRTASFVDPDGHIWEVAAEIR